MNDIEPTQDLITPERLAKGDLHVVLNWRGKVTAAVPMKLSLVKELIRRGVIPYHYEVYGVGFLELRAAFRAPWNVRSSAVLLEQWGIGVSENKASGVYQNVYRRVGAYPISVIEFVLEANKESEDNSKHQVYKDSFEKLVSAMDEERDRLQNN